MLPNVLKNLGFQGSRSYNPKPITITISLYFEFNIIEYSKSKT